MRIDGIVDDESADDGHDGARSWSSRPCSDRSPTTGARTPRDDLVSIWANGRARRLPDGAVGHGAGDGPVHLGRRGDDAHRHRPRADRADAPPRRSGRRWRPTRRSIPGAVEELIRWVTPLNNFFRTATRDAQIAGTDVRAGDRVILLYPSANRDEAVFDDPYTFDIRAQPEPARRVRVRHALLPRRVTRPARAAHAVRAPDAADHEPARRSPSPTSSRTSSSARCARAGSPSTCADVC